MSWYTESAIYNTVLAVGSGFALLVSTARLVPHALAARAGYRQHFPGRPRQRCVPIPHVL